MTPAATFVCSICGEPSISICLYCTKDACPNHICEKCGRCSDCCECDIRLDEAYETHEMHQAHEAAVEEPAIAEAPAVAEAEAPETLTETAPESVVEQEPVPPEPGAGNSAQPEAPAQAPDAASPDSREEEEAQS